MVPRDLRNNVEAELDRVSEQLEAIQGGGAVRGAVPGLAGLVAVNAFAFLASSHYGLAWIAGSLLIVLILSVMSFLPTTRSADRMGCLVPFGKLRNLRGANKRLLAALLASSFLIGGIPLVPGMTAILGINMLLALSMLDGTAPGGVPLALLVIAQSALIIGFYLWLLHYRPYTWAFLGSLAETLRRIQDDDADLARKRRAFASLLLFLTVSTAVLLGIFVLPGYTLRLLDAPIESTAPFIATLLLVIVTQTLIVRVWQSEESRRWAVGFLERKRSLLRSLLAGMEDGPPLDREEARERLLAARLMRVQSHDLLGHLPVHFLFPDLDLLLSRELSDELAQLSPGEAMRTGGH